jgi:uncharacterized protein YjbJ (UPF0337 family)
VNVLTDQEKSERTTDGFVGTLAGKAKKVTGSLVGNDDLEREGRLQRAPGSRLRQTRIARRARQRKAQTKPSSHRRGPKSNSSARHLQNEVAAQERDEQIEAIAERVERGARAEAERTQGEAERERSVEQSVRGEHRRARWERATCCCQG